MSRELPDWIEGYLKYTENTEPPRSYHHWLACSVIAGALQRKVRLVWGFETLYPNLYIVLVGPSGKTRKGIALGIAKDILSRIQTVSIAPESTSGREAIIAAMRRALTNYTDPATGVIHSHCSLSAFSEELSVFLGQHDLKLLSNMTDWYDSKPTWTYETIGRGIDSVSGVCFNLAGATAPDWLQSMLPQQAIGGGWTSRVIFVVEERKGKTVPRGQKTQAEYELEEMLVRDLERIHQLCGEFKMSDACADAYVAWYEEQDRLMASGKLPIEDPRFDGYCERRATHVRKLMMIMSASRGDSLQIELEDFNRALSLLKLAEAKMHKTFGGLGTGRYSNIAEKVLQYIKAVGTTTRSVLVGRFYRDMDPEALRAIEELGTSMKVLAIRVLPDEKEKVYQWIGPKDNP